MKEDLSLAVASALNMIQEKKKTRKGWDNKDEKENRRDKFMSQYRE